MKKTLALLLAMLMILSVVLISCGKKEEEETLDTSDDLGGFVIPSGDASEGDGSNDGSDDEKENNNSGFAPITENTKAYMLMSVNVRTNYKKSATNGAAMYGSEVVRIETNDTWTKIKYTDSNGATKEGYVYNEVLTIDAGRVGYVAEETPVQATSNTNAGTVRKVPWIGEKYNTVIDEINGVNGDDYKLKKDQAVEILGKTETADDSGNKWAYIKYVVGEKTVYGWCRMDLLNAGESVDTPAADPSKPGVPTPVTNS